MDARNNYLYQPMPIIEEKKILSEFEKIWNNFGYIIKNDDYIINVKTLIRIIERVDKKKAHYKIFHNNMKISEYKEASIYCYWLAKLKPISIKSESNIIEEEINEMFSLYYLISAIKKIKGITNQNLCFNKGYIQSLKYSLRYRNLTEEAIIAIFDSFYYHNFFKGDDENGK